MPDVGTGIAAGSTLVGGWLAGEAGDEMDIAENLYAEQAATARLQREIGLEQWNLWKEISLPFERERMAMEQRLLPDRERAEQMALRGDVMDRETYEREVAPLLSQIIDDAMAGVEDRRDYVVAQAAADVGTQFGVQREQTQREMERRGVRPDSGQYQAGVRGMGLTEAGARASAVNVAREDERRRKEDVDWQRRSQAYGMGSALRQPRFPGATAGTGGITASTGTESLSRAGAGFGESAAGRYDIGREYGGVTQAAFGVAGDIVGEQYGDVRFPGTTPQTPKTAGVTP